jgi:hypothetical protein
MDLASFFTQAADHVSDAVVDVIPPKCIESVVADGPEPKSTVPLKKNAFKEKAKLAKVKALPRATAKAVKASPGKSRSLKSDKSVKVQRNNSPAKPAGPNVDLDDIELGAGNDIENDIDEIPDEDSQWGEDEDRQQDSECGGDDACLDACLDAGLDEDLDEDMGSYDMADLDTSYSRLGAWKRRDKSTLPCPDLVGPPLTPDDDSHIT